MLPANSIGDVGMLCFDYPTEHISFLACIANDYEQINVLFDDTINEICHHILAYTTSNEPFTYSQMLCEHDRVKLFEVMEVKIGNHKNCRH